MKRAFVISLIALIVAACVGAALWKYDQHRRSFYTDGSHIERSVSEASAGIREVLWQPPVLLQGEINTRHDETGPHIAADGTTLLLTSTISDSPSNVLIVSRLDNAWQPPQPLHEINSDSNDCCAVLAGDGASLIFSSDRAGGMGGYDLWIAHRNDFGWSEPLNLGPAVNSEADERGAALSPDGSLLVFASNRHSADGTHNLYAAGVSADGYATAEPIAVLNSISHDLSPAFSAAGDFLYFSSDRTGGRGGFDLYRARIFNGRFLEPQSLGEDVNTHGNEIDPVPEASGFAIIFSSDRVQADASVAHGFDLWRAESREVFVQLSPRDFADLTALLGPLLIWLLILLLTLLMLLLSWKGVRSNKLSLLARCVLASLIAHLMLMILLTFWQVTTQIAHLMDRGGTRVMLTTSASMNQLSQQLRGGMTSVDTPSPQEVESASRMLADLANDAPPIERTALATAAANLPREHRTELDVHSAESHATGVQSPEVSLAIADELSAASSRDIAAPQDASREIVAEASAQQPGQQIAQSSRSQPLSALATTPTTAAESISPGALPVESAQPLAITADVNDVHALPQPAESSIAAETDAVSLDPLSLNEVDLPPPAEGDAIRIVERESPSTPAASTENTQRANGWMAADTVTAPPAVHMASSMPIADMAAGDPAAIAMPEVVDAESSDMSKASAPVSAIDMDEAASRASTDVTLTTPHDEATHLADASETTVPSELAGSSQAAPARSAAPVASDHSQIPAVFASDVHVQSSLPQTESIAISPAHAPAESQQDSIHASTPAMSSTVIDDELVREPGIVALNIPTEGNTEMGDPQRVEEPSHARLADPSASLEATEAVRSDGPTFSSVDAKADAVLMPPSSAGSVDEEAIPRLATQQPSQDAISDLPVLETPASSTVLDDLDSLTAAMAPSMVLPERVAQRGPSAPEAEDAGSNAVLELTAEARLSERQVQDVQPLLPVDPAIVDSRVDSLESSTLALADANPEIHAPAVGETHGTPMFVAALALIPAMALSELAESGDAGIADISLKLPTEMSAPANPYAARAEATRLDTVKRMGGSEDTERAVALALKWLAQHQSADGRWAARAFDVDCQGCAGQGKFDTDIATTGLALLCFLGADYTHLKESIYRDNVIRALQWLVEQQLPDGDLRGGETLYSHGIAAIALAEAYGMTADARLREPVRRAVAFIDAARSTTGGGWRYEPGQAGDTSVTGWQVMALMSARRAGLQTPDESFASASAWMDAVSVINRPGRYAYQPGQPPSPSMTAEGLFIQQLLGVPRDDPRMQGSVEYIMENLPRWDDAASTYYWYYATLAMFQHQGPEWERWNKELTRVLLANQRRSGPAAGSWDPKDNWAQIGGRIYQTALCTLSLEVYYRYLPMYRSPTLTGAPSAVRGTVTDASTGMPLAGATVKIDLSTAAGALIAATDADGRYALALPELPADFVAMSASRDGYVPATTNIQRKEAEAVGVIRDFALQPVRSNIIALEDDPQVHHLGNDAFEGAINSQFQKAAEGATYTGSFIITLQHLPPNVKSAQLRMMVKGAQAQNTIFINNQRLGTRLNGSPRDGSFGEFRVEIPLRFLREGENTITIRASTSMGDLDDFEFTNIQIHFDADAAADADG